MVKLNGNVHNNVNVNVKSFQFSKFAATSGRSLKSLRGNYYIF